VRKSEACARVADADIIAVKICTRRRKMNLNTSRKHNAWNRSQNKPSFHAVESLEMLHRPSRFDADIGTIWLLLVSELQMTN
jgi:hypothetical protein